MSWLIVTGWTTIHVWKCIAHRALQFVVPEQGIYRKIDTAIHEYGIHRTVHWTPDCTGIGTDCNGTIMLIWILLKRGREYVHGTPSIFHTCLLVGRHFVLCHVVSKKLQFPMTSCFRKKWSLRSDVVPRFDSSSLTCIFAALIVLFVWIFLIYLSIQTSIRPRSTNTFLLTICVVFHFQPIPPVSNVIKKFSELTVSGVDLTLGFFKKIIYIYIYIYIPYIQVLVLVLPVVKI